MKRLLITAIGLALLVKTADAGETTPPEPTTALEKECKELEAKCDQEKRDWIENLTIKELMNMPRAKVKILKTRHIARIKVRISASRRYRGHVGGYLGKGKGTFEGCGYGRNKNCTTCTPRGSAELLADESCKGPDGWHRVRIWKEETRVTVTRRRIRFFQRIYRRG